jgi:hypothetical protein
MKFNEVFNALLSGKKLRRAGNSRQDKSKRG